MSNMNNSFSNPASALKGLELGNGWIVKNIIKQGPQDTGGHFSVGYLVENKFKQKAYLKALDFSAAFQTPDAPRMLQILTSAFNFERDLLYKCRGNRLSKVVTPIEDGNILVPGFPPLLKVFYIIFELANGDIRKQLNIYKSFDLAWCLRSLHNTTVGLEQLHKIGIAHQDLKPSNVLVYNNFISKIADLGRASDKAIPNIIDQIKIPGDKNYAPFEQLYGYNFSSEFEARYATDIFLLGSLIFFFFTKLSARQATYIMIHKYNSQNTFSGSFMADLPYFQQAFNYALLDLEKEISKHSKKLSVDLIPLVKMLCEPDPRKRGYSKNVETNINQYSLERFISRFDLLAKKAEYRLL